MTERIATDSYHRTVSVLSIDGGGIRGIIPAEILNFFEESSGRPISELFDLIAGTSTGGILALGLGTRCKQGKDPYKASELSDLYVNNGPAIFRKTAFTSLREYFGPKYSAKPLEAVLRSYFGQCRLHSAIVPLLIASYDIKSQQPFFFKSSRIAADPSYDWELEKVARATSAAPTYFPPQQLETKFGKKPEKYVLIDGGVFANNPAMAAYTEARTLFPSARVIIVVSVGTGDRTDSIRYMQARKWGLVGWALRIAPVFMESVSGSIKYELDQIIGTAHYRYQLQLSPDSAEMDNATQSNMLSLRDQAKHFIEFERNSLTQLAATLSNRH